MNSKNKYLTTPGFLNLNFIQRLLLASALAFFIFNPSISLAEEWTYTTRPDDTLWDISKKYLKNVNYWDRLQKYNEVNIAKRLAPGTRLRIPLEWLKIQAAPATVVSVTGSVNYKSTNNEELKELSSKQIVHIGDQITTGLNGSALIQFADSSTLLVQKNSQVIFNTLSSYGQTGMVDTRLRLQQGRVETSVKSMRDSSSRYEITTPAAVAAVRGTQFRVAYTNDQQTMASEVVEGSVNVAAEGIEQAVDKGFGTITEQGKPPQPPVKLLDKPVLDTLVKKIRYLPFTFEWTELAGAQKYRIQISPAEEPESLSFEDTSKNAVFKLKTFENGQYILRIRGIDKSDLEGFNAEHRFEINTDFPVVNLISPVENTDLSKGPYQFKWSIADKAVQYHLQISKDMEFKNVIIDRLESNNTITLTDTLAFDQYFWRVAAVDEQGNKGKYSNIGQFTVSKNNMNAFMILLYLLPAFLL